MGREKVKGAITSVNISKTSSCHLRKLQKEKVPVSLDGYLEV